MRLWDHRQHGQMNQARNDQEMSLDLPNEAATLALGRRLATLVAPGDVVTLSGELGAGKTTLARGLILGLAERAGLPAEEVPSPSFPILQIYELGDIVLAHLDLYRIEDESELAELGVIDALEGVTVIEWPDRAARLLPRNRLDIRFEWHGQGRRALVAGRLRSGQIAMLRELR